MARMASWLESCGCRPAPEADAAEHPFDDVEVEGDEPGGIVTSKTRATSSTERPQEEVRICPVSGLSTLAGVCPFAKPKTPQKAEGEASEAKPPKLELWLDLHWEKGDGRSSVRISVRPHLAEHFTALALPDTASNEDIRRQYRKLALQLHPDKNPDAAEATEQFQVVERAYEALKATDGEMGFPWGEHPDQQAVMTGEEAIRTLSKLGLEACDRHYFESLQLRHMVRQCPEVKLVIRKLEEGIACTYRAECWVDALCIDPKSGSEHVVKLHRKELGPPASNLEAGSERESHRTS